MSKISFKFPRGQWVNAVCYHGYRQLQEDYEEEMEKLRLQHGKELNDHINITEQNTGG